AVTLHVLVRITPPLAEATVERPTVNLGLVLDRSGSMSVENKITFARQAAIFAVEQLLPSDRVSVTVFDEEVQTIIPNAPVGDKERIVAALRDVTTGGSTALHDAWREGARQVGRNRIPDGQNRVLLPAASCTSVF